MIRCPSTGQPCHAEVCNAGGWPCDPPKPKAPPRFAKAEPVTEEVLEQTEDGIALSYQAPDREPEMPRPDAFQIEDEENGGV